MNRQRAVSHYANTLHNTTRHCPEDLACKGCCSCAEMYKNQSKILKEKLDKLMKEGQDNQKIIAKMSKIVSDFQRRKEEFDKIDQFKLKVRDSIKKQLENQKKAEEFILQERIENAKKEKKEFLEDKQRLQRERDDKQREAAIYKQQLKTLQTRIQTAQAQLKRNQNDKTELDATINILKINQQNLQKSLQEKTQVITRMQNALSQTEQNFITEKIKAKNNQFQAIRHQQQVKMKTFQINSLQKTTEQKNQTINNLGEAKEKLGKLVMELDSTVHSYSQLSNQLRERIFVSEDYAMQKEIQYKQLEMDYYDTVYQRCP